MIDGVRNALRFRRTLVAALYDKTVSLSMKSFTECHSGKLISLISADLFTVERGVSIFPILFAAPIINLTCCYFLTLWLGVQYTAIVLGFWIVTIFLEFLSSKWSRKLKGIESGINDERLKLVNDLVVGCRTIKCYGWEEHYIERIREIRAK